MSITDNRIVNLAFNNRQFESGVKQSSKSLEAFEKQLEMKKGKEGLSNFQSAINKVDFSAMARGIESLEQRFSTFGIAGMNVVNRITDAIINSAKRLESATLGQIKSGGWARATNIANAKFTIEGLKYSWDEVREAADYAVTDTAYGLDSAAKAASQLAASGVDFSKVIGKDKAGKSVTQMHKSLRAISGVAAMTNSSYDDIAHTFTRIAGQGRVMGEDLNSLAARGLNAAATLATAMNTTEAEIRDMVSKGQIDFAMFSEAMDNAYGDHAKEANKTFVGSLSNMKAALSRIGAIFAQPMIDKTNVFFVAVTDRIKEFQKALSDTTDEDGNKVLRFASHFEEAWTSAVNTASDIMHKLDLSWFGKIAEKMDGIAQKTKTFFDDLKYLMGDYTDSTQEGIDKTGKTISVTAEEAETAKKVIDGAFGNGAYRKNALTKAFGADSAKRIQDYVDSVVAAGYNYEKASIKVSNANETVTGSVSELVAQAKLQRKIKFTTVINNLSAAFANLGRAAKNIFTAVTKVGTAVYNAFASVFGFKTIAVDATAGLRGLIIKIADFTEKLIVSDETAEKIKGTATKVFEVIKKAISFAWSMLPKVGSVLGTVFDVLKRMFKIGDGLVSSVLDSDLVQTIIEEIKKLLGYLKNLDVGSVLTDNPVTKLFNAIFGGLESFVSKHSNLPSTLANFINAVLSAIGEIDIRKFAKLAVGAWFINSAVTFMLSIRNAGKAIEAITRIPSAITSFFYGIKNAARYASYGYFALSIGKTILMFAGALVVISQIPENLLYRSLAVIIVMALVMGLIVKSILKVASRLITLQRTLETASTKGKGTISAISRFTARIGAMATAFKAFSGLISAMALAVIAIAVALAILSKTGANWSTLLTLLGGVSIFVLAVVGLTKYILDYITPIISKANTEKTGGGIASITTIFAILSVFMISVSASMLIMSAALSMLSVIPMDKMTGTIIALIFMFLGIVAIIDQISLHDIDPKAMLSVGATMLLLSVAITLVVGAIGATITSIMTAVSALSVLKADPIGAIAVAVGVIFALVLSIVALMEEAEHVTDLKGTIGMLLTVSVIALALGAAVSTILVACTFVKGNPIGAIAVAVGVIFALVLGISAIIEETSSIDPKRILSLSVLMLTMSAVLAGIFVALTGLSIFGGDNVVNAAFAIGAVLVAIGASIAIASSVFGKNNNVSSVIAGVLSFSAALVAITFALSKLKKVGNLGASALALSTVLISLAAAFAIFTNLGGSNNSAESVMALGAAFIMIAASLYILALAVEKMASVSDNLATVAIVFGVFLVAVIALSVVGTIFAGVTTTMLAIGKALLYAGLGFALVGAGVFLVCEGIKILAPALTVLAVGMGAVFTVLEEHKVTAIIVLVIVAAIIAAITVLAAKISTLLTKIVDAVKGFFGTIGNLLSSGASRFTNFVSTLGTRGKVMVVSLITTICSALLSASPKVISTIGQLILKFFDYLGKIAGSLALALVDFIIKLINALAEAIMANSARITNALFNVIYALGSLFISLLGQFFSWIPGADEVFEGVNEEMLRIMEERKAIAEEADQSKKDYLDSLKEIEEGTEDSADKASGSLEKMYNKISEGTGKVDGLTNAFEGNKNAFTDMVRVQGIPVEIPATTVKDGKVVGSSMSSAISEGMLEAFDPNAIMGDMMPGMGDLAEKNGMDLGGDMANYMGEGLVNEAPELYTTTTTTVQEGPVQAIEDMAPEVRKTTKEYISDIMVEVISDEGERKRMATRMWSNAAFLLRGFSDGIDDNMGIIDAAMGRVAAHTDASFVGPMKINSPSKLFMQYGGYILQGLTMGIDDGIPDAENSVKNLSDSIINTFGDPLNYISRILSGELQVDQSIQPVLDTSKIRRGAGGISAMLNGQSISVAGLSSSIAADIGQLDSRNSDVVEELRALREEMSIMGEEISNMQVVMDTGALVGATAGPMDKALGERAVRFGRGN